MALQLTDIINEFGKYYLDSKQNRDRLLRGLMQGSETLTTPGIRHIPTDDTIYQLANPMFTELLQGFQKQFTPKGNADFHPNTIQLQHMKVDYAVEPHDIEESWLGFMGGKSSKDIEAWPIVRYLMEEHLTKQVIEDKENEVVYKGKLGTVTPGTASAANTVMDGLRVQLVNGAADTKYPINVISDMGAALTLADALDYIELFVDKLPHKVQNKKLTIFVAPEVVRAYLRLKRNAGWYEVTNDSQFGTRIDFSNFTLVGVASMIGTLDIWATMPQNILHLYKRDFSTAKVDMQKFDRQVKMLIDWYEAVGFGCNQLVWTTTETINAAKSDLNIV